MIPAASTPSTGRRPSARPCGTPGACREPLPPVVIAAAASAIPAAVCSAAVEPSLSVAPPTLRPRRRSTWPESSTPPAAAGVTRFTADAAHGSNIRVRDGSRPGTSSASAADWHR